MQVVTNEHLIAFDVDDTLVLWDAPEAEKTLAVKDPYSDSMVLLRPHWPHIKLLKNKHKRGSVVLVWSQGGHQWAKAVVDALDLADYVDFIFTKPTCIVDDLPAETWLGNRIYLNPDSSYRET